MPNMEPDVALKEEEKKERKYVAALVLKFVSLFMMVISWVENFDEQ